MNGLDWAIIIVLLFSVLLATAQGFLHEVISLAGCRDWLPAGSRILAA